MKWGLNLLVKFVGALFTTFGIAGWISFMSRTTAFPTLYAIIVAIGIALLFAPEIKTK